MKMKTDEQLMRRNKKGKRKKKNDIQKPINNSMKIYISKYKE